MADRTQHEGKTERVKESHDRCSQPPSMRVLKTTDLGAQALLVVNSFKLHLTALITKDKNFFLLILNIKASYTYYFL